MTQMIESYITLILCRSTSQERTYNVYSRGDPRVAQARGRPVPGHTVLKKLWSDLRGNSRKYRAWLPPHKAIVYSGETLETLVVTEKASPTAFTIGGYGDRAHE